MDEQTINFLGVELTCKYEVEYYENEESVGFENGLHLSLQEVWVCEENITELLDEKKFEEIQSKLYEHYE
jgi:hypothetical protein